VQASSSTFAGMFFPPFFLEIPLFSLEIPKQI